MATRNSGIKLPARPAPGLPIRKNNLQQCPERSNATDYCDPFSPQKLKNEKKKPPPRPPPPRVNQGSNHLRSMFGSSKRNAKKCAATAIVKPLPPSTPSSAIPTGTLIDLSPPSSPKSLQKFNNDNIWNIATSNKNSWQGGGESGFEDDFSSMLSSGATTPSVSDPWSDISPSPEPLPPPAFALPSACPRPTIICVPRAKPARPPPPGDHSPPMPSGPPPPPPPEVLQVLANGPDLPPRPVSPYKVPGDSQQPICVALYDYESSHTDDLDFKTGEKITVIGEEADEWLRGRLRGREGIFPKNYVRIMSKPPQKTLMWAIALFPFVAQSWDDLDLKEGDRVKVLDRVNQDWLYGECGGRQGQFPESFIQDVTDFENDGEL